MITIQDLYNIVGNKIEQMCNAIDQHEAADHFQRFLTEWIEAQQRQQQAIQAFLQQYYNR